MLYRFPGYPGLLHFKNKIVPCIYQILHREKLSFTTAPVLIYFNMEYLAIIL